MTRAHVSYAERRPTSRTFAGTDVSEPEPTDTALLADIFAKMEEVLKPLPGEE